MPDGSVHYLHADVRGNIRVVTDAVASVTDSFTYSVDGAVTGRTGSSAVSVGWNGEYTDPDTGLVWLRARWYDPGSARFLSADPWHGNPAVPVSLNRYLFGNADPVNNTDPTGLSTLIEQEATMALRLEINSIEAAYYMGLLSTLRTATTVLSAAAGVLATGGAAYWAVTAQAGDPNDQDGIDGPGTVPDIEIHENDDLNPDQQPQADGAGMGLPPRCYAPWDVAGDAWDEWRDLEEETRAEALRRAGIQPGDQPIDILQEGGVVQYLFEAGDGVVAVTFQPRDFNHDPHWEWGSVKYQNDSPVLNGYGIYRLSNAKQKWDIGC